MVLSEATLGNGLQDEADRQMTGGVFIYMTASHREEMAYPIPYPRNRYIVTNEGKHRQSQASERTALQVTSQQGCGAYPVQIETQKPLAGADQVASRSRLPDEEAVTRPDGSGGSK